MGQLAENEFITPPVRLHFPALFKKAPVPDSDKETFQATMIIPQDVDMEAFLGPWKKVLVGRFGRETAKKVIKQLKAKGRFPIHDSAEKDYDGYEEGTHYINASANYPPLVIDQKKRPILDANKLVGKTEDERDELIAEAERRIYAGCWVRLHINLYAWDNKWGKGVSFGFKTVQLVKKAEPFSVATQNNTDAFDEIEDDDDLDEGLDDLTGDEVDDLDGDDDEDDLGLGI